jgi:S1-C subfamily serine protease
MIEMVEAIGVTVNAKTAARSIAMKFSVKLLYGLIIWLLSSGGALSDELPDIIDTIRNSVVAVGTVRPVKGVHKKGPPVKFRGTGFIVSNGRQVITNHHVLPDTSDLEDKESLAIFSGRGKKARAHKARLVRSDPDHDLALLEISGAPLPVVKLGNGSSVREGVDVAVTGFPIGMVLGLYPVTHRGIVAAITPIVIPAISSRTLTAEQIKRMRNPYVVYQLDMVAYPGNSGSPVYDVDTGQVIGVVNSVFVKGTKESVLEKPSGISYAIPIKYVHDLLKKN